jgi:hypothetical protein
LKRLLPVALLFFAGCAATAPVQTRACFPDGRCVNALSFEQRTSMLNTALITAVEAPAGVQTTVQGGTSTGRAMLDAGGAVVQAGGIAAAGALFGTGNNQVNVGVIPK